MLTKVDVGGRFLYCGNPVGMDLVFGVPPREDRVTMLIGDGDMVLKRQRGIEQDDYTDEKHAGQRYCVFRAT
jgi:hypothetical protein